MALAKSFAIILLFVSVVQASDGQQGNFFRDDYEYFSVTESFYKIHTIPKSWQDAKRRCALEGATLVVPENVKEINVILAYLNKKMPQVVSVYVGISSLLAKGVFLTVNGDSIRDVYNVWSKGEPNNELLVEDCVILLPDGTYNDVQCTRNSPFICKKTLESLKWNQECATPYSDYKYNEVLGKCYKFHLHPLSWRDAVEACDAEQAYLAIINSQDEAEHLVNVTASAPKDKVQGWYLRGAVHLGFNYDTTEDDWKTIKGETLDQAGYAVWSKHRVNGGEDATCGSMLHNGHFRGVNCKLLKSFFICEKETKVPSIFYRSYTGTKSFFSSQKAGATEQ